MEVFKRIKDFDNYAISKEGNIKNIKLNKLANLVKINGIDYVSMYQDDIQKQRSVPKLLSETFKFKKRRYVLKKDRLPRDDAWIEGIKELEKVNMAKIGM